MTTAVSLFAEHRIPLAELLANDDDPNLRPPEFILRFATAALADPDAPVTDKAIQMVTDWAVEQRAIARDAADLLDTLHTLDPMPTPDDIINGVPHFPAWAGKWWAATLRFPWAGRLGEAVCSAHEWLDERG